MEYYMLLATDADDAHEARMSARAGHLQRLEALKAEGWLLIAGPNPLPDNPERFSGSLIVAQFASLDDAQSWAEQDPANAPKYSAISGIGSVEVITARAMQALGK